MGANLPINKESWNGPLISSQWEIPRCSQQSARSVLKAGWLETGASLFCSLISRATPRRAAISANSSRTLSQSWFFDAASQSRISTVKFTRPGMILDALGSICKKPMVPVQYSLIRFSRVIRSSARDISLTAAKASRRLSIGIPPACAAVPVTVTVKFSAAQMAFTTPRRTPEVSRTLFCSMCSSTAQNTSPGFLRQLSISSAANSLALSSS